MPQVFVDDVLGESGNVRLRRQIRSDGASLRMEGAADGAEIQVFEGVNYEEALVQFRTVIGERIEANDALIGQLRATVKDPPLDYWTEGIMQYPRLVETPEYVAATSNPKNGEPSVQIRRYNQIHHDSGKSTDYAKAVDKAIVYFQRMKQENVELLEISQPKDTPEGG